MLPPLQIHCALAVLVVFASVAAELASAAGQSCKTEATTSISTETFLMQQGVSSGKGSSSWSQLKSSRFFTLTLEGSEGICYGIDSAEYANVRRSDKYLLLIAIVDEGDFDGSRLKVNIFGSSSASWALPDETFCIVFVTPRKNTADYIMSKLLSLWRGHAALLGYGSSGRLAWKVMCKARRRRQLEALVVISGSGSDYSTCDSNSDYHLILGKHRRENAWMELASKQHKQRNQCRASKSGSKSGSKYGRSSQSRTVQTTFEYVLYSKCAKSSSSSCLYRVQDSDSSILWREAVKYLLAKLMTVAHAKEVTVPTLKKIPDAGLAGVIGPPPKAFGNRPSPEGPQRPPSPPSPPNQFAIGMQSNCRTCPSLNCPTVVVVSEAVSEAPNVLTFFPAASCVVSIAFSTSGEITPEAVESTKASVLKMYDSFWSTNHKQHKLNENNRFLIGVELGSLVAYSIMCSFPSKFTGMAAISGQLPKNVDGRCCPASRGFRLLHAHGTHDRKFPYDNKRSWACQSPEDTAKYIANAIGGPVYSEPLQIKLSDNMKLFEYTRFREHLNQKRSCAKTALYRVDGTLDTRSERLFAYVYGYLIKMC